MKVWFSYLLHCSDEETEARSSWRGMWTRPYISDYKDSHSFPCLKEHFQSTYLILESCMVWWGFLHTSIPTLALILQTSLLTVWEMTGSTVTNIPLAEICGLSTVAPATVSLRPPRTHSVLEVPQEGPGSHFLVSTSSFLLSPPAFFCVCVGVFF